MSDKKIVVEDCTLTINGVTPGTATITTTASTTTSDNDKGVYKGTVMVQLSGCSSGTYQQTGIATGTFSNGSQYNLIDDEKVLLENDKAENITVTMQNTVSPFDSKDFTASVEITNAGNSNIYEF